MRPHVPAIGAHLDAIRMRAVLEEREERARLLVRNQRLSMELVGRAQAALLYDGWTVVQSHRVIESIPELPEHVMVATIKRRNDSMLTRYTAEGACSADALWNAICQALDAGTLNHAMFAHLFKEAA